MTREISSDDKRFSSNVEACEFPVNDFDHRAHLRLAYVYLVERGSTDAITAMRDTLTSLLLHAGIEPSARYHETLTKAC